MQTSMRYTRNTTGLYIGTENVRGRGSLFAALDDRLAIT